MSKEIDFNFVEPEEKLGYLLWQASMKWQREANRALFEVGLTSTQFAILMALAWLSRASKNVTQKEIAETSKTDRMMVSKILRTLEKAGVISRIEHETDTRAKCVSFTKKGTEILQRAIAIKEKSNQKFFKSLSDEKSFAQELKRLID